MQLCNVETKHFAEIEDMHHDMRLFLNTLSLCLEKGDTARAKELLSSYSTRLHESGTKRYCSNDTINYILSDFDAKCGEADVKFIPRIMLDQMTTDLNLFCRSLPMRSIMRLTHRSW